MTRHDLLELTPQALMALANAGFVKRAQKEIAAGYLPALTLKDDGTLSARFDDGTSTELAPNRTLRGASCTCPASGMCRHRVMLVLAYQAQTSASLARPMANGCAEGPAARDGRGFWSPAQFDDAALIAAFASGTMEQAHRLAAARPVISLQPWRSDHQPPAAKLPMCSVRFFSRHTLNYARCDCQQGGGCAHVVLAVWAFRAASALPTDVVDTVVQLAGADPRGEAICENLAEQAAQTLPEGVDRLLHLLWLDGSGQPLQALVGRMDRLRAEAQALGWRWVDDTLDELWQLLQAQQARSSRFDPQRLLLVQAELWARLKAAEEARRRRAAGERPARPASLILGEGVQGEVALDHLRLVSLGAQLWSDDQNEGASVLLCDPDTQTVMVLERRWSRAADAARGGVQSALGSRRVAGKPLRQLAGGQIVTKAARRRANGRIDIGAGVRETSMLPLSPTAWDSLEPPLRQTDLARLVSHLRSQPPDFVQPRLAANGFQGALHVLDVQDMVVHGCHWDAAAQRLHASIGDAMGAADDSAHHPVLHLTLLHRAVTPNAVDTLARALAGEWGGLRALAGPVELRGGQAHMQPLAVMTSQRAVLLQLESATCALPRPASSNFHLRRTHHAALVEEVQAMLAAWLRQGLRHQAGGLVDRIEAQAQRLQAAGLLQCAARLRTLPPRLLNASTTTASSALVTTLSSLTLLLHGVLQ